MACLSIKGRPSRNHSGLATLDYCWLQLDTIVCIFVYNTLGSLSQSPQRLSLRRLEGGGGRLGPLLARRVDDLVSWLAGWLVELAYTTGQLQLICGARFLEVTITATATTTCFRGRAAAAAAFWAPVTSQYRRRPAIKIQIGNSEREACSL